MSYSKSHVILLTACISPEGMIFTKLQDSTVREAQYINAINYYLANTEFKIVFCNNSGEDISNKIIHNKNRVEFLSFNGNNFDKNFGKGYGEFIIIKYALENSLFIKEADYIIKITGRIKVKNITKSLFLNDLFLVFPKKRVYITLEDSCNMATSNYFIAPKSFFDLFVNIDNGINDSGGYYFEHLLFDFIERHRYNFFYADFLIMLDVEGVAGTNGVSYISKKNNIVETLIESKDIFKQARKRNKSSFVRSFLLLVNSVVLRAIRKMLFIIKSK